MKSTGVVRKLDELGRIVLPMEVRKNFGLAIKEPIEIYTEGNTIILKKHETSCIFCGDTKDLKIFKGKLLCPECETALKGM